MGNSEGPVCDLMHRQCCFQSLGVAGGHMRCVGSMMDWVDARRCGVIGGVQAGPRVGFGET